MTSPPVYAVQQLFKRYSIDDPTEIPIEDLIQAQGAMYEEKPMNGAEGRIIFGAKSASVTVNSLISNSGKRRFVRAHELGHLSLHRGLKPYFRCDESDFYQWNRLSSHESEANEFASELLMPSDLFRQETRAKTFGISFISELADLFQTSFTATTIRYSQLGPEPIAVFWSLKGVIQWSFRSDAFIARYLRKKKTSVHPDSKTYQFYQKGTLAQSTTPQLVLPEVWLDDKRVPNDLLFYEDCLPMPKLEAALSCVWMSGNYR